MGGDTFKEYIKEAPLLIDFLLDNILREKNNAKTPQDKAALVSEVIEVLQDVNNKIIQSEYVKMVSTALEVNENALLKELNKYSNAHEYSAKPKFAPRVVTNSSQFALKAQKNLLSVFLSNGTSNNFKKLSEMLPDDIIRDETLIIVKNTIDKLSETVNNVRELTNSLYTEFIEDDKLTQILTDLIEMSEAFAGLDEAETMQAVRENIVRLKRCYSEHEAESLRQQYREVNNNDVEALKLQKQLNEKIKLRTGDK